MSLNRVTLIGNLTRDPELRTTPNGASVASFGVATNYSWTDASGQRQDKAEFHNIVAWGKLAEICSQFMTKGRKVYVDGRLQTREWDGQDGSKKNRTEIVAENVIILDRKPGGATGGAASTTQTTELASATPAMAHAGDAPATDEIRVEDIPF